MNQYNHHNVKLGDLLEQKRRQLNSQKTLEIREEPKKMVRNMSAQHNLMREEGRMDQYSLGSVIGKGSYAIVRMGTHKETQRKVAIKVYDKGRLKDPQRSKNVVREISVLNKVQHPNVIALEEVVNNYKSINLVMEYAGQVSLLQHLKRQSQRRLSESACKPLFRQVVQSVQYLHQQWIVHRDLKLENIMWNEPHAKLIDFGFALQLSETQPYLKSFCGTPCYMAPEMLSRQNHFKGPPVDCWALGVLLFVLLSGKFPFRNNKQQNLTAQLQEQNLFRKIKENNVVYPDNLSGEAQSLMRGLLTSSPSERLSAQQVLAHRWLMY